MEKHDSVFRYAASNFYWGILMWAGYKSLLFRRLPGHDVRFSVIVCVLTVLGGVLLGSLLNSRRGLGAVMANLVLGYGIYTAVTYYQVLPRLVGGAGLLIGGLLLLYALILAVNYLRSGHVNARTFRRYALAFRRVSFAFLTFGCCVMLGVIGAGTTFSFGVTKSAVKPESIPAEAMSSHMPMLMQLCEGTWQKLDVNEKLDVLQTVVNIEAGRLGLPAQPKLFAVNTDDEGLLGYYQESSGIIGINVDSLIANSSWVNLRTAAHEVYHAYQHRMVELYSASPDHLRQLSVFEHIPEYCYEFDHYTDADDDYEKYHSQKCETDARAYADEAVVRYYEAIYRCLVEEKTDAA